MPAWEKRELEWGLRRSHYRYRSLEKALPLRKPPLALRHSGASRLSAVGVVYQPNPTRLHSVDSLSHLIAIKQHLFVRELPKGDGCLKGGRELADVRKIHD